jgi:ABC-type sugar transport system permease subunit
MLGTEEKNFARLMVLPAVGLLFLVTIGPLLFSLGVSFTNLQFGSPQPMRWSGLDNYVALLFKDPRFLNALWRTFLLVCGGVIAQTVLGYVIASLLYNIHRGRTLLLTAILVQSVISQVVAGGREILWGQISAAAIIAIGPGLLIAIFLQKYLTRGLTMGAVK